MHLAVQRLICLPEPFAYIPESLRPTVEERIAILTVAVVHCIRIARTFPATEAGNSDVPRPETSLNLSRQTQANTILVVDKRVRVVAVDVVERPIKAVRGRSVVHESHVEDTCTVSDHHRLRILTSVRDIVSDNPCPRFAVLDPLPDFERGVEPVGQNKAVIDLIECLALPDVVVHGVAECFLVPTALQIQFLWEERVPVVVDAQNSV